MNTKIIRALLLSSMGLISCVSSNNKKQMNFSDLSIRGSSDFELKIKDLPVTLKKAESLALVFQKSKNPSKSKVVIGPVVGFNGKDYLLTSPEKDGAFKYQGILVDGHTGEVTRKTDDDGKLYKLSIWIKPFIWSE
jgi:hypothetical protein